MYESKKNACYYGVPKLSRPRKAYFIGFFSVEGQMKEHGLYIIKDEFLEVIRRLGGDCDYKNGNKRPIYCCIKDNKIENLYWAIPTSDINHRSSESA